MTLVASVTTPVPQLVFVAVVLVGVGWASANIWSVLRLKRMRARNLRIVADLRRLTNWLEPDLLAEPGLLRHDGGAKRRPDGVSRQAMRISELSRGSGVSIATIKF